MELNGYDPDISQLIRDRSQEYTGGRRITAIIGAVKTECPHVQNEFRSAFIVLNKSQLKMNKRLLEENRQCATNTCI